MKILVRAPNWIGDQLMTYPFFYYLREKYPNAHIAVACSASVSSLQFKNLIDEVIVLKTPEPKNFLNKTKALFENGKRVSEKGNWDLGITLTPSFSGALFLYLSHAKERVGFDGNLRSFLLTKPLSTRKVHASGLHRAEEYVELLGNKEPPRVLDFWGKKAENDLDPPILGVQSSFDPSDSWPEHKALDVPKKGYYLIAPGSAAESRRAPAYYFLELMRLIWKEYGWIAIIVGGVAEAKVAKELLDSAGQEGIIAYDATAQGSVASLWGLFQNAKLALTCDSGLAHLASLCGCPTYILWGAGNPHKTRPLGPGDVYFQANPVDCWPCEKNICSLEGTDRLRCLKGLDIKELWEMIERDRVATTP